MNCSIVEYFAEHEGYRCGYCKSTNTNYSHGMWAHSMTVVDYENLLNRGWRRSGKYMYKPTNNMTCCPCYTIKCDALEFKLSKSQKKVLKRFNNYLIKGELKVNDSHTDMESDIGVEEVVNLRRGSVSLEEIAPVNKADEVTTEGNNTVCNSEIRRKIVKKVSTSSKDESSLQPIASSSNNVKPSQEENPVPTFRKAKDIRREKKRQKLLAKGIDPDTVIRKTQTDTSKPIEELIQYPENSEKKLVIKIVRTETKEFMKNFEEEHQLYRKYQMVVHGDSEDECTKKQFKRFLCDTPLVERRELQGSFHQQYYIGSKLIAVGVIDILPHCLSSVYFFYDPDIMSLSPGTYGALREIAYVRELNKRFPALKNYYMGFYIHSCPKMRYKGNYFPSYLLCPEEYTWHLLDDNIRDELTKFKYKRLNPAKPSVISPPSIAKVKILYQRSVMPYAVYAMQTGGKDAEEVQQYCSLVGSECAENILLFRC